MAKSRVYQLYELKDELKKSIKNLNEVEQQEKLLVGTITMSSNAEVFKDFTKGLSTNWPNYENQRKTLTQRINKLDEVIKLHEDPEQREFVDMIVTSTIEGLGLSEKK